MWYPVDSEITPTNIITDERMTAMTPRQIESAEPTPGPSRLRVAEEQEVRNNDLRVWSNIVGREKAVSWDSLCSRIAQQLSWKWTTRHEENTDRDAADAAASLTSNGYEAFSGLFDNVKDRAYSRHYDPRTSLPRTNVDINNVSVTIESIDGWYTLTASYDVAIDGVSLGASGDRLIRRDIRKLDRSRRSRG